MCFFWVFQAQAAAIDELSCICQQPGQNLLIYINKYRELHWWCTKKLPWEETYKLTLSQFCSSLKDLIGRKLCEKLWDDKESCKLMNLQKCFNKATQAYKQYRVTEHRRELEVFKTTMEVNETSYHHNSNHGGQRFNNYNSHNNSQGSKHNSYKGKTTHNNGPKIQCKFCFGPREIFLIHKLLEEHANKPKQYTQEKAAKSTAKLVKNIAGNSAHIDEIELEALAEFMDHPIEHIIHEINMFISQK